MTLCDYCCLKDGLCAHIKEMMKHILSNTGIDGSQLCPLLLASATPTKEVENAETKKSTETS